MSSLPDEYDYACFVSFAQADKNIHDPLFTEFLDYLNTELIEQACYRKDLDDKAYFLINRLDAGDFREELARGLNKSVCVLSLYSPLYWSSAECTKERKQFLNRDLRDTHKLWNEVQHFEFVPIPWVLLPEREVIPAEMRKDASEKVDRLQWFRANDRYKWLTENGVKRALEDAATKEDVKLYIRELAGSISAAVKKVKEGRRVARTHRPAHLYVLAAEPDEVADILLAEGKDSSTDESQRRIKPYQLSGGADWHPFSATPELEIKQLVWKVLQDRQGGLGEVVGLDTTLPSKQLGDTIKEKYREQEYVVVVVDPWSVTFLPRCTDRIAEDPDHLLGEKCIVLVVQSKDDPSLNEDRVQETLDYHLRLARENTFYAAVESGEEFRRELARLMELLRPKLQKQLMRLANTAGPTHLPRANGTRRVQ
jgi:hypothetical protein